MTEEKNSFIVFTDIKEILDDLDDNQVAALFRGMVDYQETGEDPNFKGALKYIFIPIRQQMDRNNEKWNRTKTVRSEAGKKGGIRSGEVRSKTKQNEANEANASFGSTNEANEANEAVTVTDTVTVTDNVTVTVGDELSPESLSLSLVNYLNEKSGGSYQADEYTVELITDLLGVGYTEADIRSVIDRKCSEWLPDPKMRQYLRPSTLFGSKFGEYLAAPKSATEWDSERRQQARTDLQGRRNKVALDLLYVQDMIDQEDDPDKARPLYDQEAALSEQLQAIDKRLEAMA